MRSKPKPPAGGRVKDGNLTPDDGKPNTVSRPGDKGRKDYTMCKKNEAMEQMMKNLEQYEAEKKVFEDLKKRIGENHGYNSAAYKAIKDEAPDFPYTDGEIAALHAYLNIPNKEGLIEVGESIEEVADFVVTLRESKIRMFVLTASDDLMEQIVRFEGEGCRMKRTKALTSKATGETYTGLLFMVKKDPADNDDEVEE